MQKRSLLGNKQIALLSFALILLFSIFLLIDNIWIASGLSGILALLLIFLIFRKKREAVRVKADPVFEEPAAVYTPIHSDVRLKDVAGLDDAKEELFELKDFLNSPGKYKRFNARIPKGVLLIGPPGVGKTMIAKALAGEAKVPFFYQSGSSFVEIYVGMGAKKVHDLFQTAKKNAPSIIFIDEIDSVGKARGGNRNDEREATLNQLLTEMDGFESNSGVVVLAATNKIEMLDSALLRAGRFDRHVHLSLPSVEDRRAILESYLKKRPNSVDIERLAFITSGFSGAALENLVNEASLHAIHEEKKKLEMDDFMAVKDKVLFGKKQYAPFSLEEREKIAFYQSAKALIAKDLGLVFEKITLFENSFLPVSMHIESSREALSRIAAQIGGIVAYDIRFSERFNNIRSDIRSAETMIRDYLERFNLEKDSDYRTVLEEAKDIAAKTFNANQDGVDALYEQLLNHEVVCFNDL